MCVTHLGHRLGLWITGRDKSSNRTLLFSYSRDEMSRFLAPSYTFFGYYFDISLFFSFSRRNSAIFSRIPTTIYRFLRSCHRASIIQVYRDPEGGYTQDGTLEIFNTLFNNIFIAAYRETLIRNLAGVSSSLGRMHLSSSFSS